MFEEETYIKSYLSSDGMGTVAHSAFSIILIIDMRRGKQDVGKLVI